MRSQAELGNEGLNMRDLFPNSRVSSKLLAVALCAFTVEAILACIVGIGRPYRGDEPHFVETIVQFGTRPLSLDLLAHYNEMSGPVPFVLYGTWGRLFGFEPHALRAFSILVAVATYVLLYWFLDSETGNTRLAAFGTTFVALHPYMLYLSLFVYTDMLAILCLIGALIAVRREKPMWLATFLCGAVLNRQYLIFATAAAGAYFLARCGKDRQRRDLVSLLAVVGSTVPLAGFCLLWRGLCPDGALKQVYFDQHMSFHVSSLVLYVSLTSLYLAPVLAFHWREFVNRPALICGLALCGAYWFFPVAPSRSAIEAGTFHVGMLHRTLHYLLGKAELEHAVFFVGFAGGVVVIVQVVGDAIMRWWRGDIDFQFFLDLNIVLFLAVMPLSYLHWEKYFIPLMPVLLLRIAFVPFRESRAIIAGHRLASGAAEVVQVAVRRDRAA